MLTKVVVIQRIKTDRRLKCLHTQIHTYICVHVCVCVCIYIGTRYVEIFLNCQTLLKRRSNETFIEIQEYG